MEAISIELDPELGEPYPWLANIRFRRNDPAGSLEAGRKGVELQPDLPEAHYFYGGMYYMLPEYEPGAVRMSPSHLSEAIRLQPRFHAAWLSLGIVAAFLGKHAEAIQILEEAVRMETRTDLIYRFAGARSLLGVAHIRSGAWDTARAIHLSALDSLGSQPEHVYTTAFQILSACSLGDIELRCGQERIALTRYRQGRRILRESPRTIGAARLTVRVNAGLAAAYASTGEKGRALELRDEALGDIQRLSGQTSTMTHECSFAQLWLTLAVTEVRLGNPDAAAECMTRCRKAGWLDLPWLLIDPELAPLRESQAFRDFAAELASAPDTVIPMPPLAQSAPVIA